MFHTLLGLSRNFPLCSEMPFPIEIFASLPHIIEQIFLSFSLEDLCNFKQVNSTWEKVISNIEAIQETKLNHHWFQKTLEPIELNLNLNVSEMSLVGDTNWLFLSIEEQDFVLAYDCSAFGSRKYGVAIDMPTCEEGEPSGIYSFVRQLFLKLA